MLGKTCKLGILTGPDENLGIPCRNRTPSLALKRTRHDCSPTGLGPGANKFVDELNKLV